MILRTTCEGHTYTYAEKRGSAMLTVDETRLLWWGKAGELPGDVAPLEVLLKLSVLKNSSDSG